MIILGVIDKKYFKYSYVAYIIKKIIFEAENFIEKKCVKDPMNFKF